jgi:hypothetical protein
MNQTTAELTGSIERANKAYAQLCELVTRMDPELTHGELQLAVVMLLVGTEFCRPNGSLEDLLARLHSRQMRRVAELHWTQCERKAEANEN